MVLAYASLLWIRGIRNITFSTQFLLFIKSRWYSLFTTRYSRFTTRDSLLTTRYSHFTTKLFHDPSPRTNVAGRNDRTHDRPHTRRTRIRLSYCARGCTLMHHMLGKKVPFYSKTFPCLRLCTSKINASVTFGTPYCINSYLFLLKVFTIF